jgi:hypothetical protein
MKNIGGYRELRVYQAAMDAAMKIFHLSKKFPVEERYSLNRPNPTVVTLSL